ncbi:hypothetical protein SULAZ_1587 [Sulfurihydrogenibium azorense Az-Fu1]|uniref:Uncharacterized protein n=1 Tax=Sulfurihydrogenibium azorense (strain DSM 15241 / OCM 825 / Az-Fu1) TaxID=204536 RepID=C1DWR4_SULAA|nr:hypothetical protein SULAZ_1587 [Sulfurihydrogenibium azorense Az-Fu1]
MSRKNFKTTFHFAKIQKMLQKYKKYFNFMIVIILKPY